MGKLINGIKYMYICNDNYLKQHSLEDNLYFTLRDIFWNCEDSVVCMIAKSYIMMLNGEIDYESRTDTFQYAKVLNKKYECYAIINWLSKIKLSWFEFENVEDIKNDENDKFILFDIWWKQFEKLKEMLREHYEIINE